MGWRGRRCEVKLAFAYLLNDSEHRKGSLLWLDRAQRQRLGNWVEVVSADAAALPLVAVDDPVKGLVRIREQRKEIVRDAGKGTILAAKEDDFAVIVVVVLGAFAVADQEAETSARLAVLRPETVEKLGVDLGASYTVTRSVSLGRRPPKRIIATKRTPSRGLRN